MESPTAACVCSVLEGFSKKLKTRSSKAQQGPLWCYPRRNRRWRREAEYQLADPIRPSPHQSFEREMVVVANGKNNLGLMLNQNGREKESDTLVLWCALSLSARLYLSEALCNKTERDEWEGFSFRKRAGEEEENKERTHTRSATVSRVRRCPKWNTYISHWKRNEHT